MLKPTSYAVMLKTTKIGLQLKNKMANVNRIGLWKRFLKK